MTDTESPKIQALYGVYNANGGLFGELAYITGKVLGTTHCALCDITHGLVKEKASFTACRADFSAPLKTVHINEQPHGLAKFTAGRTPCVVADTQTGFVMILDARALEACEKSVDGFSRALTDALAENGWN